MPTHVIEKAALTLGAGFLELLDMLACGVDRQEALGRSFSTSLVLGTVHLGHPVRIGNAIPRHGTECVNELAGGVYDRVMLSMSDAKLPVPSEELVRASERLLFSLCWQVEATRNHVVYGMPLEVAAQFGVDVAAGRRKRASRKGHTKTSLPLPTVLQEVRWARAEIGRVLTAELAAMRDARPVC